MIDKLQLLNFQAHKNRTFTLEKVTTFVGETDSGKSAITRALRWLCVNKPAGKLVQRHGTKKTVVKARVDGTIIKRTRSRDNYYHVDGEKLQAFRKDLPPEVHELLQVDDLNFQTQHKGMFWLDLTPSQVSKEINKLVELDIADGAVKRINKKVRGYKAEAKVYGERKQTLLQELKDTGWVVEASKALRVLVSLDETRQDILLEMEDLDDITRKLHDTSKLILSHRRTVVRGTSLARSVEALRRVAGQRDRLDELTRTATSVKSEMSHRRRIGDGSGVRDAHESWSVSNRRASDLQVLVQSAELLQREQESCSHRGQHLRRLKVKLQQKLKGRKCPTCRMPIP